MSYDYCSCDSVSYPYSEATRKAKKEHVCGECSGKIKPGEKYWYATGLCEGEWFDAKVCAACEEMYLFVKAHVPCLCVSFGNQHEELLACARGSWTRGAGALLRNAAAVREDSRQTCLRTHTAKRSIWKRPSK
jgi:hypothetical protein